LIVLLALDVVLVALVFFRCLYYSIKKPPVQGVVTVFQSS